MNNLTQMARDARRLQDTPANEEAPNKYEREQQRQERVSGSAYQKWFEAQIEKERAEDVPRHEQERKEAKAARAAANDDDEDDKPHKKPRRTSFRFSMADDLPEQYEALDELIEGIIVKGKVSILYGESNSGKTFLGIDMACAVARGEPWFNKRVQQGLVIYLAAEAPASVKQRLQAYQKHHECKVPNFVIVEEPINLADPENAAHDIDVLIALVRDIEEQTGQKAALIIGDTLACMSAGSDENSGKDMGMVIAQMNRIRTETGAHFMMIHHSGKDQSRGARGHSSLKAAIDTEIEVQDTKDGRFARVTKQRDLGGKGDDIGFRLQPIEIGRNRWGDPAKNCVVVPADAPTKEKPFKGAQARVIELVTATPGILKTEVRDALLSEYAKSGIYDAIRALIEADHLKEDNSDPKVTKLFRQLPALGGISKQSS